MVENAFRHLAPTHLVLNGDQVHPWLEPRPYPLTELRRILLTDGTPYEVRDEVWRHTIRAARRSSDWMTGALGLCMPALRAAASRAGRGFSPADRYEVESAVVAATIQQVRTINLSYWRLAWYLTRPAHRAGLSARKHEMDAPTPYGGARNESDPGLDTRGNCDLVLIAAVRGGVITASEADLIASTRLEDNVLADVAQRLGVSYKAAAKRRERAEKRLAKAIRSGDVQASTALDTEPTASSPAGVVVPLLSKVAALPVSHSRLRPAS
ncbi:sigma-70 family RNA polymerase sigma factor [Nocardiopsis changdeensis]|uniref:Sigma-70 family RNA polymerase sigma factor n=1 Tax=Nocardiopsis changdeensis TaxID=2831969 RepID=A0ABX8BNP2_9ACTN|nr:MULTISPECIES: sigma-70 family RNA polymerase sigma factor [Nocardiopsis]QUX22491.1 sigma-70 family RNA polymerase sigma factor [Nocardiopsis changdeensis]QYX38433.1 sigma-70 family RNA polymerase sigma factor [Nocardiopsis sp. MT53]